MEGGQQESGGKHGLVAAPAVPIWLNPLTYRGFLLKEMQPRHSISFGISERLEIIKGFSQ